MSEERRLRRPGTQRTRRIATAATIVSAGTVTLLLTGLPAQAGAAAKPCPEPKKPEDIPAYWECLRGNIEDAIKPKPEPSQPPIEPKPEPAPKTKPPKPKPKQSKPATPKGGGSGGGSSPQRPRSPQAPPPSGSSGSTVLYTDPASVRALPAAAAADLPGTLPAPEVAPHAQPASFSAVPGETRLITPVAAQRPQDQQEQLVLVAVASAAAGAVGALNISVLARRARRRTG
ncbi:MULTISPECIES: hypothetical protein [Thermomonospora]|uniref:Uncharacterized protein n=1 Tax=Thermomonospora curvata (strain ATCC 19995 / DSM 43183 / JCM 3096 / KCTC 9072 / NBRC 15933 / NCIMB 10081 / Henssen B9) TaxID=471852 RepID=D1A2P7_THECD|nr:MULTISPECIES: hypothetical protein [Thermomonospora]ACY97845.1 hypothetical protein Tcur_2279 [Thermomonospora curvata DSM 43183]PKK14131.1 MAG: hypothetical protein BUE48_011150 [Thermomonospora sp. CIF 1]